MSTYKVIEIIGKLSTSEFRSLIQFLNHHKSKPRKQVKEFALLLYNKRKYLPATKDRLEILTGLPQSRLNDLTNKMLKIVEEFCLLESILSQTMPRDRERHLAIYFMNKNLHRLHKLHKLKRDPNNKYSIEASSFEHLSIFKYLLTQSIQDKLIKGRNLTIHTQEIIHHLDLFYCIERLKLICEEINRNRILGLEYQFTKDKPIVLLAKQFANKSPLVYIYLNIISFLQEEKDFTLSNFEVLLDKLKSISLSSNSKQEIITPFHFLINLTLSKIKAGASGFSKKILELISTMENSNLLIESGYISSSLYKTVISQYLKTGQSTKAQTFLNKYSNVLQPENRGEVKLFCSALIAYYSQDYQQARTFLNEIYRPNVDQHFNINIKKLEIQIFIEEQFMPQGYFCSDGDGQLFDHLIRNFRIYIHERSKMPIRDKKLQSGISKPAQQRTLKFIQNLRSIVKHYHLPEEREKLYDKIVSQKDAAERNWLLSLLKVKKGGRVTSAAG